MQSKGLALQTVIIIVVSIAGAIVLLTFMSGTMPKFVKKAYCFFYQGILGQQAEECEVKLGKAKQVVLKPKSRVELAQQIAAHAIACMQTARLSKQNETLCYTLILKTHPGKVDEEFLTSVMEEEHVCDMLQNSMVVKDGKLVPYEGDCGIEDELVWQVYNGVIENQSVVLIKYSRVERKVIVKA